MLERVYYIPIYDISIRFSIYKFKKNIAYNYYLYTYKMYVREYGSKIKRNLLLCHDLLKNKYKLLFQARKMKNKYANIFVAEAPFIICKKT